MHGCDGRKFKCVNGGKDDLHNTTRGEGTKFATCLYTRPNVTTHLLSAQTAHEYVTDLRSYTYVGPRKGADGWV